MPQLLAIIAGAYALGKIIDHFNAPTAFISFAAEDANIRDLLVGQSKNPDSGWRIRDTSLHEPFSNAWKTQTREIIADSDLVIVLIGHDTYRAEGALWEIECAQDEGVPIIGVHISADDKGRVPRCLRGERVIEWTQKGLAREIKRAVGDS